MTKFIMGLILVVCTSPFLIADIVSSSQQNGQLETLFADSNGTRAVYLGRLFEAVAPPPTGFTGIAAGVVLREANNVQLWVGDGVTFSSATLKFDTGLRFTNLSQTDNLPVFAPQIPNGSPLPGNLDFVKGLAIRNLLATSNRLDFWLVGNGNFSAPSGTVGAANSSFPFVVQLGFTAVPEPSSMLLAFLTLIGGGLKLVRNRAVRRTRHAENVLA